MPRRPITKSGEKHRLFITLSYPMMYRMEKLSDRMEMEEGHKLPMNQIVRKAVQMWLDQENIPHPTEEELEQYIQEVKERSEKYSKKSVRKKKDEDSEDDSEDEDDE